MSLWRWCSRPCRHKNWRLYACFLFSLCFTMCVHCPACLRSHLGLCPIDFPQNHLSIRLCELSNSLNGVATLWGTVETITLEDPKEGLT
ncbi:hypothetical protein M427DRAFT_180632 [Gonapodya prolifera JEL478]|uniref:Secreted protein n=1 Tax=Gonapodya prolifera (strain JEL478) TaxID=1344416 RepID=A0A139AR27_GONPJ|nr:hypothetical protein M427DRAFT_180632 [Gonapodya prolifera JEL478]|eukprot:KXS18973.1 hypothetical protein M427DRAFT_180632 [Gonapodya prolifera JEL478]